MMKTLKPAAILLITVACFTNAWSQTKLSIHQVKQIDISTYGGGLGGYSSAHIKVVPEAGKWNSYITRKVSAIRLPVQTNKSYDSILNRHAAVLTTEQVNNLLNSTIDIKPVVTASTFKLTAQALITELKASAKTAVAQPVNFGRIITQPIIDSTIKKAMVNPIIMDAHAAIDIYIISKQNDTLKLSTRNLNPTKLPWKIGTGNKYTYNMSINNFVLAAINNQDLLNKQQLSIDYLKEDIFRYIDEHNPGAPIATFKWQHAYPQSLSELEERFTIKQQRFLRGNVYACQLKTMQMPDNAVLYADIDMTSRNDIKMVVAYANLIDKYFKAGNFVLNYYGKQADGHISFSYNTGRSPYRTVEHLRKKIPTIPRADSTQMINFGAGVPNDSSSWILFPDNSALLTYHSVTTPNEQTAPIYPVQPPGLSLREKTMTLYWFDGAGKVTAQGK